MTRIVALELPLNRQQLIPALEQLMMGLELVDFVAQQQIILGDKVGRRSLTDICQTELPVVLEQGLSALSAEQLVELLNTPACLLELQEQIYIHGGEYWNQIPQTTEHRAATQRLQNVVRAKLTKSAASVISQSVPLPERKQAGSRPFWTWTGISTAISIAATLLLAIFVKAGPEPLAWSKPGVLTQSQTGQNFKLHLARSAEELFADIPQNQAALEQRLEQTLYACDALLQAELTQLTPAERAELKQRCQNWRSQFAAQLADLRTNRKTAANVSQEYQQLGERLQQFLKTG
jgi:hypothetical protein